MMRSTDRTCMYGNAKVRFLQHQQNRMTVYAVYAGWLSIYVSKVEDEDSKEATFDLCANVNRR